MLLKNVFLDRLQLSDAISMNSLPGVLYMGLIVMFNRNRRNCSHSPFLLWKSFIIHFCEVKCEIKYNNVIVWQDHVYQVPKFDIIDCLTRIGETHISALPD